MADRSLVALGHLAGILALSQSGVPMQDEFLTQFGSCAPAQTMNCDPTSQHDAAAAARKQRLERLLLLQAQHLQCGHPSEQPQRTQQRQAY